MNAAVNRQVRLKRRPSGIPQADDFEVAQAPVPEPGDGQVLVRNIYLSVDPAMRGWVSSVANYSEPVPIGGVMRSIAVGRVVTSRHPDYHAGDVVTGQFGWQHYAAMDGTAVERRITDTDLPMSTALGVLGINGVTAYFGLLEVGQPRSGDTVVVSTAAGSVGSCVGQIAVDRPCGMHRRTFDRLSCELETLVALSTLRLAASLGVEMQRSQRDTGWLGA